MRSIFSTLFIYLFNIREHRQLKHSKNIELQDNQAEWLHLRKPIKTYKYKNNHEHNNISWEQIRIDARETEGQYILNEDLNSWMELKLTRKTTCVAYTKLKGATVTRLLCQLIVIILGRHTDL